MKQRLLEIIAQQRTSGNATVVHEPVLRDGEGEVMRSGPLDIPMRVDIVLAKDGEVIDSINVDTEEMLSFEPFEFTWPDNGLAVRVEPFQWNWLQVQTTANPEPDHWHAIRDWYLKWVGEDDPTIDQVAGAVHFLDDPRVDGDAIQFTMDLGTSPVECLEELFDALGKFGAPTVRLPQFAETET